ncbi:unnamed protein product [Urochloa decumbens]|uniref:Ubiquitin-like protease family profile domain-containing protein n=1 Tax=Urochloa decumbens TaxID=240449 RepID=A0ABC9F6S8_9POAL
MSRSGSTTSAEEEEVIVKIVDSHSNFGPHPHELELYHGMSISNMMKAKEIFEAYGRGKINLHGDHIVHNVPTKLAIDGVSFSQQMMLGGAFGVDLCDAIMRLYKALDDRMYEPGQTRWRHFLPASFAAKVLNGENYIEDAQIRASFIGQHITYNVEDCTMIIVPVLTDAHWSCYFWDFAAKKIHVLDPTMMRRTISNVQERHNSVVTSISDAISRCIDTFFQGWAVDMNNWRRCFPVRLGVSCHKNNSGLFATHYSTAYDGIQLLWDLKSSEHGDNRSELLFQLLWMKGNCGQIPPLLIDLMDI